jgi:hypothetical protein
MYNWN